MALLGNYNIFNKNPGQVFSADYSGLRASWNKSNQRGAFYGPTMVATVKCCYSVPGGYTPPYTWIIAPKAGGLRTNVGIQGVASLSNGNLASGKNMVVGITASASVSATMKTIIQMLSALSASGVISSAALIGKLNLTASLAATGNLTATLKALGKLISAINTTSTVSPQMNALANLESDILPYTVLSPESLANAVWSSLATSFNESGTMGEKLNDSGSAGDPWDTDLSSYSTEGTAGKKLKDGLTLSKFIGLK